MTSTLELLVGRIGMGKGVEIHDVHHKWQKFTAFIDDAAHTTVYMDLSDMADLYAKIGQFLQDTDVYAAEVEVSQ